MPPYVGGNPRSKSGPSGGTIKTAKGSIEIIRAKRGDVGGQAESAGDDASRNFMISNVGAGGTLYQQPSRLPPQAYNTRPATPPTTAQINESARNFRPGVGVSGSSYDGFTPRIRGSAFDKSIPMPPLSLANVYAKRRPRSHSFSTVSERRRSSTLESFNGQGFHFVVNDQEPVRQRPKSSTDLADGLLNLRIPHYRLGTPQFSERGTAYLHNSICTTDDAGSSTWSRVDYNRTQFLTAPSVRGRPPWIASHRSSAYSGKPRSRSLTPRATPPKSPTSNPPKTDISPKIYDIIEANANDPGIVRFSPQTGRIVAATPARLIAQLTSPKFLDYTLLSDFLLTYRGFLSSAELTELLFARLKWAIADGSDSGRIARVRTFVALRHWMLNYFEDDFIPDYRLRARFCDLVNGTWHALRQKTDSGTGDMNILGELKKCWRRTCVKYWPVTDLSSGLQDPDIEPGVEVNRVAPHVSALSLPLALRQDRVGDSHQVAMVSEASWSAAQTRPFYNRGPESRVDYLVPRSRTTSIPATPMSEHSEQSLQVLSCSVPFLKHVKPSTNPRLAGPRPVGSQRHPPVALQQVHPTHRHQRTNSFTDALRDERPQVVFNTTELEGTDDTAILAGLVRGLTLQPCPAKLDVLMPSTPVIQFATPSHRTGDDQSYTSQNLGVKRIVGDVRRALGSRKGSGDSPTRSHRSGSSSSSRGSIYHLRTNSNQDRIVPTSVPSARSEERFDTLGALVEESYLQVTEATQTDREDPNEDNPSPTQLTPESLRSGGANRGVSQVTTSSQSIMIVDATGPPELPMIARTIPSVSSWSTTMAPAPLFRPQDGVTTAADNYDYFTQTLQPKPFSEPASSEGNRRRSFDTQFDGLHVYPDSALQTSRSAPNMLDLATGQARTRKSSSVHSANSAMSPGPNQLRRRPGGDLKAVGHVHDLEPEARTYSGDTFSTMSRSLPPSGVLSQALSGMRFSGQHAPSQLAALRSPIKARDSYNSLGEGPVSEPFMRPSIEADLRGLAVTDTVTLGGGIEDALRKLEGTYASPHRSRSLSSSMLHDWPRRSFAEGLRSSVEVNHIQLPRRRTYRQGASIYSMSQPETLTDANHSSGEPMAPVLQRASRITRFPMVENAPHRVHAPVQNPPTAMRFTSPGCSSANTQSSFLLDDDESLSELSTELDDAPDESLAVRSFFFDDTGEADEGFTALTMSRAPPTPPATADALVLGSVMSNKSEISSVRLLESNLIVNGLLQSAPRTQKSVQSIERLVTARPIHRPPAIEIPPQPQGPAHLPFILAFDSLVLAHQLTLIEKCFLDEISWKDFLSLTWSPIPPKPRNWVAYLQAHPRAAGIDLVTARFNLASKWVVSEILLTTSLLERARTVAKFIHIAEHCRRLRNYATLYQIVPALLGADISRLKRTWARVPVTEKATLAELETLCHPARNFSALRHEMETAASPSFPCIPLLALYTHDLSFNAQKPSSLPSAPSMVNFDRYSCAAGIVKSLLMLLEASGRYRIKPEWECLSRCFWLAALSEGEIDQRARALMER